MSNGFLNNLAPDDVEHLIQKYATDEGIEGCDVFNGHGRINAGLTVQMIEKNKYHIMHNSEVIPLTNYTFENDVNVIIPDNFYYSAVQSGIYSAKRYKVTVTIPHNIGNATIIDAWVRNSSSSLLGNTPAVYPYSDITLENYNNTSATLSGYVYLIIQNLSTQNMEMTWLPISLNENVNWAYSLHLQDAPVSIDELRSDFDFNIYPNPTSNSLNLSFSIGKERDVSFVIYDITGKALITTSKIKYTKGKHTITINQLDLANGFYNINLNIEGKITTKKIIINKK